MNFEQATAHQENVKGAPLHISVIGKSDKVKKFFSANSLCNTVSAGTVPPNTTDNAVSDGAVSNDTATFYIRVGSVSGNTGRVDVVFHSKSEESTLRDTGADTEFSIVLAEKDKVLEKSVKKRSDTNLVLCKLCDGECDDTTEMTICGEKHKVLNVSLNNSSSAEEPLLEVFRRVANTKYIQTRAIIQDA